MRGIGKVKAVQLKCLAELAVRMSKAAARERLCFDTPATIADYYMEELRREEQEELIALFLDTRNRLLRESLIFRGTVNASPASPREIFVEALSVHAVRLVLVHNHPSGDPLGDPPFGSHYYRGQPVQQSAGAGNPARPDGYIRNDASWTIHVRGGMFQNEEQKKERESECLHRVLDVTLERAVLKFTAKRAIPFIARRTWLPSRRRRG